MKVAAIYLPANSSHQLVCECNAKLAQSVCNVPWCDGTEGPHMVIGIAGSVAVGKSTFARILQALLARWPDHPRVDLITTDGFLFPNAVLEDRGIMNRKGFPESYDTKSVALFSSRCEGRINRSLCTGVQPRCVRHR